MNLALKAQTQMNDLLVYATEPDHAPTQVFASVILSVCRGAIDPPGYCLGLDRAAFMDLLAQHFPAAHDVLSDALDARGSPDRVDEFNDLLALILEHRNDDSQQTKWLAYALASGCMGNDRLYVDMGFPDRSVLSGLLEQHFTALYRRNIDGAMKWKKFFYKQLCERADVQLCPAPSCQVCHEYSICFALEV
ncbi:MAG: nitrogen fixation protein NifQ [Betaproteobacteria bacterium]|nr:nitrogen fixation protein NifQ [Betaproteobacteria bacterium]